MREYIILNNKNSEEINGLLIQTLPSITKPKIRTRIEEVDGLDGDIITKLGYGSYTKEFQIGLYGDYDVDEVISYFDSEGIVTFSNEPDKYYRYQIFEQIDFQKLIRFKTANVIMHIQPFKYSTVEKIKSYTITNQQSITIRNNGNINSKPKFTVYGNGNINISLNNTQLFVITLGTEGYITIDTSKMEAYKDGILKNRLVTGNYDNFKLNIGNNSISWTGNITKIDFENYSRWI